MAVKTFYILANTATAPGYHSSLQDGGTAPAAAAVAYGWTVAKVAASYWRGRIGATARATASQAGTFLTQTAPAIGTGTGATTAGDCFVSPTPYSGAFAAGNWVASFGMRTGATNNAGRIRFQLWAGTSRDGVGARKIGTVQDCSAVTMASTAATYTSTLTWNPGAITLDNEYLFFEVEWQNTNTGGSNSCSALFRQGESSIVTSDYVLAPATGTGALASDVSDLDASGSAITPVGTLDAWNTYDRTVAAIALSNGDKTATYSGSGGVRSSQTHLHGTAGKYYAEAVYNAIAGNCNFGLLELGKNYTGFGSACAVRSDGWVVINTNSIVNLGAFASGDVVGLAWDAGAKKAWFRKNGGLWDNTAGHDPSTNTGGYTSVNAGGDVPIALLTCSFTSANVLTVRTEFAEFTQAVPAGFVTWMDEIPPVTGVGTLQGDVADLDAAGLVEEGAPGGAPWTPVELGTDLIAWYDFSDSATVIQSGGFLTQWRDKSVNARHANAMSAGTLSVVSDGIYIANVTSGPNLAIQMPALPSAYFDFAFAGKPNPFGSYRTLMAQQVGGQHHMLIEVGTNKLGIYAASWFPAGSLEWPPVDGQAYYSGADASNIRIGRDGNGLIEIVGENLTADNAPCLLNYSVGGGQGFGTAREFVFMTATRSQDIQDRVSGYLAWKWDGILGVTTHVDALPVGHPYKAAAPTTGAVSVIGSATLDAARSEIIATGEAVTTTVTGTGALFQQGVSLSGVGLVQTLYSGTGALVTVSTLAASGTVSALGTGALVTSASATGAGTSLSGGTAALAPAPAVLTGKQGDVLQAGDSTMLSYGVAQGSTAGSGVLPGTVSTIVASGVVRALGTGSLAAQVATAPAMGLSRWVTAVALQPGQASLAAAGGAVIVGTGALGVGVTTASPSNMVSPTTPAPYVASASNDLVGYEAWHAFDGDPNSPAHSNDPIATTPYWLKIDLGLPRSVVRYTYQARNVGPYHCWKTWTLEGSNDDTAWTLVDTVIDAPTFTVGEERSYVCDTPSTFRYWRWNVTATSGISGTYAEVGTLELWSGASLANSILSSAGASRSQGTGTVVAQIGQLEGFDQPAFLGGILKMGKATMTGTGVTSASGRGDLLPSMAA